MVLNPRGYNNNYEVAQEIERLNSFKPLQYTDSPGGRFLSEIRDSQLNVRSPASSGTSTPVVSGQAIGQTHMVVPQAAPDLFQAPPPPVEVYRAEELSDVGMFGKEPDKTTTDKTPSKTEEKGVNMKFLGEWPIAPIVIGGVIVLVFYGLYRVMKK